MMGTYRTDRINDQMTQELAVLVREIKDPRVSRWMVSITQAQITPDLKYAKVFYSAIPRKKGTQVDDAALRAGLKSATPFLRRRLAQTLNLRITPELNFTQDHSMEYGAHISSLLSSVQEDIRRFDARAAEEAKAAEAAQTAADDEFE